MLTRTHIFAASLLLLCFPLACAAQQSPKGVASPSAATAPPAGWTLVFSDEFDRPGSLDPSKWGYETGYIRNKEAQFYTSRARERAG